MEWGKGKGTRRRAGGKGGRGGGGGGGGGPRGEEENPYMKALTRDTTSTNSQA